MQKARRNTVSINSTGNNKLPTGLYEQRKSRKEFIISNTENSKKKNNNTNRKEN